MGRPIHYKAFRSRKSQKITQINKSILEVININKKVILDIGCGTGDSSIFFQKKFTNFTVCGLESYKPGIKNLIDNNIYAHHGDALELLEMIQQESIDHIYMLFPDPWQKKKHRKRRLFNSYTFDIIDKIIKKNGLFHFATDNINYALEAMRIVKEIHNDIKFSHNRGGRPITKFEKKAIYKNNFIFDLIYIKK